LQKGDPLFTVHASDHSSLEEARQRILIAHSWSETPVDPLPLFYSVIKGPSAPLG
jgi:hypothetical protein